MFRGIVVLQSLSPKYLFNSDITCWARFVRSSSMVRTTPSMVSSGWKLPRIRRDQSVQRKQIERGRTVKHNELIALAQNRKCIAQPIFAAFCFHQFEVG